MDMTQIGTHIEKNNGIEVPSQERSHRNGKKKISRPAIADPNTTCEPKQLKF